MAEASYRHIRCATEKGVLVITIAVPQVEGIEISTLLRDEMLQALDASDCTRVAIDFQHTKYISSVAFRPLLVLWRRLKELNGRMMVCGLSPVVGDVFYTTKMVNSGGTVSAPFELETDVAAAVARLSEAAAQSKDVP
jgi:anti-anti-sigma factor